MADQEHFYCDRCGKSSSLHVDFRLRHSRLGNGKHICYNCCGIVDRERMMRDGTAMLYLGRDWSARFGYSVGNWPNTLSFRLTDYREGNHNMGITRRDLWFVGPDSWLWWGRNYGPNSDIVHCRRTKIIPHLGAETCLTPSPPVFKD